VPSRRREESPAGARVAERIEAILGSKDLSLYRVSQQSAALYGKSSPFFVPHNLYYALRSERFTPSVHQILALSRISDFRFPDWLRVFGFDLEEITRLQVQLPSRRTILLDTSLTDPNDWVSWVRNRASRDPTPSIVPLRQLLEFAPPKRIGTFSAGGPHFLYAKIGFEDALGFPDLIPGSIVRVNPEIRADPSGQENSTISHHFFLIEHSKGFCCCRIRLLANGAIVPFTSGLSYAQVELRVPQEAKIKGAVDLELRPLLCIYEPRVPRDLARRWNPQSLPEVQSFGGLLKAARLRLHSSTREAARASRMIADLLKDDRYISSSSSLSAYELRNTPPRDFHKIMALCSIYGVTLDSVMKGIGVDLADSGTQSILDRYLFRTEPTGSAKSADKGVRSGFLERLLDDCQKEVPFFLRDLTQYFSGSAHRAIDDFFWIGGDHDPLHPYLANGLVVLVNRRRKTPFHFVSQPVWQQPIYVVLTRDRGYLAACCGIEDDKLVIHPHGPAFHPTVEYRHHRDAEVVGQIVAIARRFP
jgi:transcriptional regulator with XRE-family HTH domain